MQMYTLKVLQVGLGAMALATVVIAGIAGSDARAAGVASMGQASAGTFRAYGSPGVNNVGRAFTTQQGVPVPGSTAPADASPMQTMSKQGSGQRAGHGGLPGVGN